VDKAGYRELAGDLQKNEGASYICLNYGCGLENAAIHMGFGRKVNHCVAAAHGSFQSRRITDVTAHKCLVRMIRDGVEIARFPAYVNLS
jgi:hypothetical protein